VLPRRELEVFQKGRSLSGRRQFLEALLFGLIADEGAGQGFPIGVRVHGTFDLETQRGAFFERLDELVQLVGLRRDEFSLARFKLDKTQLFSTAHQCAEQLEWGRRRLRNQIYEHLQNDRTDAELRIVQPAFDWQVQIDAAAIVFEESHAQ